MTELTLAPEVHKRNADLEVYIDENGRCEGLYNPNAPGHDACGVTVMASLDGEASHEIIQMTLEALANTQHRAGLDADQVTGDGVGIKSEIPQALFKTFYNQTKGTGRNLSVEDDNEILAVGQLYLPRDDHHVKRRCFDIIDEVLAEDFFEGIRNWRFRVVPEDKSVLGETEEAQSRTHAYRNLPLMQQLMIPKPSDLTVEEYELKLYLMRKRIEQKASERNVIGRKKSTFYFASLSARDIVYKYTLKTGELGNYFIDLKDPRFKSTYAMGHGRFATNVPRDLRLVQILREIAHNGEINTNMGNIKWWESYCKRVAKEKFGRKIGEAYLDTLFPLTDSANSDSANMDAVVEFLLKAGHSYSYILTALMPEAIRGDGFGMKPQVKKMLEVLEAECPPAQGPAFVGLGGVDGKGRQRAHFKLDAGAYRPGRYQVISSNGKKYFIGASEDGVIAVKQSEILQRGRLGPGESIAVDIAQRRVVYDKELKEEAVDERDFEVLHSILQPIRRASQVKEPQFDEEALLERQLYAAYTNEDISHLLIPMAEEGKEPLSSMGDDAALTFLSRFFQPLHNYLRQAFAQVTNPPTDPIREKDVTRLVTTLGGLCGKSGKKVLQLESPILTNMQLDQVLDEIGNDSIVTIDCTFRVQTGDERFMIKSQNDVMEEAMWAAIAGKQIVLSDKNTGPDRAALDMPKTVSDIHEFLLNPGVFMDKDWLSLKLQEKLFNDYGIGKRFSLKKKLKSLREDTAIHVCSAQAISPHAIAVLIGVGANTVNPYLAEETLSSLHKQGMFNRVGSKPLSMSDTLKNFIDASEKGLLKIMSKTGVQHVASYRGAVLFETLGLCDSYITGAKNQIGGIGRRQRQKDIEAHHLAVSMMNQLPEHGFNNVRQGGERHANTQRTTKILQMAAMKDYVDHATEEAKKAAKDSSKDYSQSDVNWEYYENIKKKYREHVKALPEFTDLTGLQIHEKYIEEVDKIRERPIHISDLLRIVNDYNSPISLDQVESVDDILKTYGLAPMSIGALSPEGHAVLTEGANLVGAGSSSGEGGQSFYAIGKNSLDPNSSRKQLASGGFGSNTLYLLTANEIGIKVSQGAKPGEGGQLQGAKVDGLIAKIRQVGKNTLLVSPPPNHDIYSIEDLAQLIYDLKQVNPKARIEVKLTACSGIGSIACGVAKAGADVIHISGNNGGTGASPLGSIKHAGMPKELGIAEAHQALTSNNLREDVILRADGHIQTAEDEILLHALGADEFTFGTNMMIAGGCDYLRQCHTNKCPTGMATQDPELRKKLAGNAHTVKNFLVNRARAKQRKMAKLGIEKTADLVGNTDWVRILSPEEIQEVSGKDLNLRLDLLLYKPKTKSGKPMHARKGSPKPAQETIDQRILKEQGDLLSGLDAERKFLEYDVCNTFRSVGAHIGGRIVERYSVSPTPKAVVFAEDIARRRGEVKSDGLSQIIPVTTLSDDALTIRFNGSAGQSFGAWIPKGLTVELHGAANDGVGKGLSGGIVVVRPHEDTAYKKEKKEYEHASIGQSALYRGQSGKVFINGTAGQRFAVKNGGIDFVVEGVDANGCEYMTNGTGVVLGDIGPNFGAGMSGDCTRVFVYDPDQKINDQLNTSFVDAIRIDVQSDDAKDLKVMLQEHFDRTQSARADQVLKRWKSSVKKFRLVLPKDQVEKHLNSAPEPVTMLQGQG